MAVENVSWGEARDPGIAEDGEKVPAQESAASAAWRPALVDLLEESREGYLGVRLLRSRHSDLPTGVPDPPHEIALLPKFNSRHRLAANALVLAKAVPGGLYHEYSLATAPAGA